MTKGIAKAALQYSKRLSKFICWVWAIYRFSIIIAAAIVPSAAEALVSTIAGIDTIMLVNEGTYLVNSLGEKIIYSDVFVLKWLDKSGFKSLLGKLNSSNNELDEEGEDNGGDQNG